MEDNITILFRKYIERQITPAEVERLKAFISRSEQNKRLFTDFLALHKAGKQADMLARMAGTDRWEQVADRIRRRRMRRRTLRMCAAAAVAVLVAVSATMFIGIPDSPRYTDMQTAMEAKAQDRAVMTLTGGETIDLDGSRQQTIRDSEGRPVCETKESSVTYYARPSHPVTNSIEVMEGSTYRVTMPDGTLIVLNSGASLTYTIGGSRRDVTLRGEAFFDVRHDPHHPFTIGCANGTLVTVLGTRFNIVTADGRNTCVTVETDSVHVSSATGTSVLHPGEQVEVVPGTPHRTTAVDARLYTSWANGIYEFSDAPMQTIVRQLSLWYDVDIEIPSHTLRERKFTGALLRDEKLGYSLSLLKEVSGIDFKMQDGKIIIE